MASVVVNWDFTCHKCPRYIKADKPRSMGTCSIYNRKVAKTHTCRRNPLHRAFLLYMFGTPVEQAIEEVTT